jgi:hypothetical protein
MTKRIQLLLCGALIFAFVCLNTKNSSAQSSRSQIVSRALRSEAIAHNKIGTDPVRPMLIYLPAGYDEGSSQRYPVIYFLPNPFEDSYRFDFDHRDGQGLFDRAIADGVIKNHSHRGGYEYSAGNVVVRQFPNNRQLGRFHDSGAGAIHRCQLQNHTQ